MFVYFKNPNDTNPAGQINMRDSRFVQITFFSLFVYFFSVLCLHTVCLLFLEWKKLNIFLLILIRMRLKLKPERKNQPWVYFQIMFNRYKEWVLFKFSAPYTAKFTFTFSGTYLFDISFKKWQRTMVISSDCGFWWGSKSWNRFVYISSTVCLLFQYFCL